MFRNTQTRRGLGSVYQLGMLASLVVVAAGCGSSAPVEPEKVGSADSALLSTACTYDATGNLTLKVVNNEVAYIGFQAGCTAGATPEATTPCVVTNAVDATGNACKVSSLKGITVTNAAVAAAKEKVILDYTNGLFGLATGTAALVNITLDTSVAVRSQVYVMGQAPAPGATPPVTGSNMAAGVSGLSINTLTSRSGGAKLDVKLSWSTTGVAGDLFFIGGGGADRFTADAASWTVPPSGWDTSANVAKAVGAAYLGALDAAGGDGNDILGGGAGANTLSGGPGNDTFLQGITSHAEVMKGGDGVDFVDYGQRSTKLSVTIGTDQLIAQPTPQANDGNVAVGTTVPAELDNVWSDIEIVRGGSGDDTLDARSLTATSDVVLLGGLGNDTLYGGLGNDELCGEGGNDRLMSSPGLTLLTAGYYSGTLPADPLIGGDYMVGGAGSDTVDYSNYAGVGLEVCLGGAIGNVAGGQCETDRQIGRPGSMDVINNVPVVPLAVCPRPFIRTSLAVGGYAAGVSTAGLLTSTTMANDVENVTGTPVNASKLYCGTLACTAVGGSGIDTIVGSSLNDAIFGGGGADLISTGGGADLIDLTHAAGGAATPSVTCVGAELVTILASTLDTVTYGTCVSGTLIQK
jgi:Ca2+-binding RTX toxin-like protein